MRELLTAACLAASLGQAAPERPGLEITSPLGRTGVPGAIRIVAQVRGQVAPGPVRFYVDGALLGADGDGPPYALEWIDENPFERREIEVVAEDAATGNALGDKVVLEPLEITEESRVTSVLLDVSVQDAAGRFVKDLPPSAFTLFEDGVRQDIEMVRQEEVGATIALLVDSSASMSRRIDFVQRTAATLAGYMSPRDRMMVTPFSKVLGATTGPSSDPATIRQAIAAIVPTGGTAILDAVIETSRALRSAEGRRVVVLISDGYDEHSRASVDEALDSARAAGVTVYVVAVGGVAGVSFRGERELRKLASTSGGRYFVPSAYDQLDRVHDALTADIQNRYLVSYTPINQRNDGTWRAIGLQASNPDLVVRTREGYQAPAPPPIRPAIEFTALDPEGRYLDVSIDDIEIEEDGAAQPVDTFHEASQPMSVVLVLDTSGSMRGAEAAVIESARGFVNALRPEDRAGLVLFSDRPVMAHGFTTDRNATIAAVDRYSVGGGTALYDAVADALTALDRTEGRRVVVVMTDGRDEDNPGTGPGSIRGLAEVLSQLKETGATMFGIGLGSKVDRGTLERFADASGGRALFPRDPAELTEQFRVVSEDLRRRYVVSYTSTHHEHDGRWREVVIRLRSAPTASIRSAGGYYAPDSHPRRQP